MRGLIFYLLVLVSACATTSAATRNDEPTAPTVVHLDSEDVQGTAPCEEITSWGEGSQRYVLLCSEDDAIYLRRPGPRLVPLLRETGGGAAVLLNAQDVASLPLCQQLETWREVPGGITLICRPHGRATPIVQWTSVIAVGADGQTYLR